MARFNYTEPFLPERIEDAKTFAKNLIHSTPKTEEELSYHYRILLCIHYDLLFFDPIWEGYTLDKLATEWFIIEEQKKTKDSATSEVLTTEYKDDLSAIADEMEAMNFGPLTSSNSEITKEMLDFMDTGTFPTIKGE